MSYVVAAVATLLLALGALGMVVPGQVVAIVSAWSPDTLLAVGVGTRLAIGVIFLFGASRCRIPAIIYGIGILALAGALLLVLLGEPGERAVHWWSQLPAWRPAWSPRPRGRARPVRGTTRPAVPLCVVIRPHPTMAALAGAVQAAKCKGLRRVHGRVHLAVRSHCVRFTLMRSVAIAASSC